MLIEMHCPFRPLDWRWQRAQELANRPPADPEAVEPEDLWTRLAAIVPLADGKGRDSCESTKAASAAAAIELHRTGGFACAVLQARLLAGESDDAIAAKMGVNSEVVAAYEALFYSVRDRLSARDWIMGQVLRLYPLTPESRSDKTNLLRLYGYCGGPLLVDLWTAYFTGGSLADYGADADVRAMLDLLVRLYEQPMTDLAATLRGLTDYEKLLNTARNRSANAAKTPNNPLPLDPSAAAPSDIRVDLDVVEPAQAQEASMDAA